MNEIKVLELYSGIGGMHLALKESQVDGKVYAAVEINTNANAIYKHNFPDTPLLNLNIVGLSPEKIKKMGVDTILMSPPCQPFTRNGLQNDTEDTRTDSFQHLLDILPELSIKRILIENVKGFEKSKMRDILVNRLKECDFVFQEFILSPTQLKVPNSRSRYYCLAKKLPENFPFEVEDLMTHFPPNTPIPEEECFDIETILDENAHYEQCKLPLSVLRKRLKTVDICYSSSKRSCCFTKGYGRYIKGTGSIYTDRSEKEVNAILGQLTQLPSDSPEHTDLAESLNLRFFTPKEICRLMCFPESFSFPKEISVRQQYMMLGNSINVKVVGELIKILCS